MTLASSSSASSSQHSDHQDGSQTTVDPSEGASQSPRNGLSNALFELEEHPIDESPCLKVGSRYPPDTSPQSTNESDPPLGRCHWRRHLWHYSWHSAPHQSSWHPAHDPREKCRCGKLTPTAPSMIEQQHADIKPSLLGRHLA